MISKFRICSRLKKLQTKIICNFSNRKTTILIIPNETLLMKEEKPKSRVNINKQIFLTPNNSSKQKQQTSKEGQINIQKVHKGLEEIFKQQSLIFQISKHTRILPYYFSGWILDQFIENLKDNTQYQKHIRKMIKKQNKKTWDQQQTHQSIQKVDDILFHLKQKHKGIQKAFKYLQCYIDFLHRNSELLNKVREQLIQQTKQCFKVCMNTNNYVMNLLNMQNPQKWFFQTRRRGTRKFIYHHGPTNSGKTHHAIKSLKNLNQNEKGIYMAPLRLLAWQVQQKLGNCNLITGQEKQYNNSNLTSCTIETLNVKDQYDVAVIDQIQMIGDQQRGWSWTRAILGTKAKIIHLCGDQRALGLIKRLTEKTGDILQEKAYSRRSKLHLIHKKFEYRNLEAGDCIISFSVDNLYGQRAKINKMRMMLNQDNFRRQQYYSELQKLKGQQYSFEIQKRQQKGQEQQPINQNYSNKNSKGFTAIVYGKLPPQSRKNQAKLFNNRTLPYLVATDAIGMGLNLNINRVIFMSLLKRNNIGKEIQIQDHQIRQIAGRAGRNSNNGFVQCFNNQILNRVKNALKGVNKSFQNYDEVQDVPERLLRESEAQQQKTTKQSNIKNDNQVPTLLSRELVGNQMIIQRAGLLVQFDTLQRIRIQIQVLAGRPIKLSECLTLFMQLSKRDEEMYFIQKYQQTLHYLNAIEELNLDLFDQFKFASIPLTVPKKKAQKWIYQMASQFKESGFVAINKEIVNEFQRQFARFKRSKDLSKLQDYFNFLDCYLWLWGKFQIAFIDHKKAKIIMDKICLKINQILAQNIQ